MKINQIILILSILIFILLIFLPYSISDIKDDGLLIKPTGEKTLHLQKFQGLEKWLIQEKQWSKDNENIYINLTINTTVYNFIKDAYQNPTMAKCLKAEPYIKEDYPNFACSNAAHRQLALTKFENFVTKGFKIVKQGVEQGYISLIGNKVYIVVPLSSISLNNSIEIGESSLVYVYKEVLTVNYQSFNLDLNTTLERCDKNRENCGVAYPNVSIINSSNLKFGAEDTEVNENTNYRYVFKSKLRIKESGNNEFLLNHKYLGKTGEGLNSYENVFLNIQDICDVTGNFDPNCEYLINDSYDYEIENTTEIICNEYGENETCIKNETIEHINTIPIFKFSTLNVYFTGKYNLTEDRIFIDPFYHTNGSAIMQTDFYSTWNTSKVAGNKNVTLPLESGGTYDFKAYWGDGTNSSITAWNDVDKKHDYTTAGVYNITLSGTIVGFRFNNGLDKLKIIDIKQWGQLRLGNSNAYFYGASNLNVTATDILNLTGTTTLANMFRSASVFNQNIGKWNTSKVTSMASMFWSASKFNNSGNGSINNWDTHNVTSMADMFRSTVFNQNIGSWNTSKVTSMEGMFLSASKFNNSGNKSINNWDTQKVTSMASMFSSASVFNQNIGKWNTSKVTTMANMFNSASKFNNSGNKSINNWDTHNVTTMDSMFRSTVFNQNIGKWNTAKVTTMASMFNGASKFNNSGNSSINNWDTHNVTTMASMFSSASVFNQNIGKWNTSKVTTMLSMFQSASAFNNSGNSSINNWKTSQVNNMTSMFSSATKFNQNIGSWNVSKVKIMSNMFLSVTLPTSNYDNLLIGWGGLPSLQSSVTFHGGSSKYCSGDNARNDTLIGVYSWTITDGGLSTTCDVTPPKVRLVKPVNAYNQTANATIVFNCTATDNVKLVNISLYLNTSGTFTINTTQTKTGTSNSSYFTITNIKNGGYKWNCRASDNSSNRAFNETNRTFTVTVTGGDTVKPTNVSLAKPRNYYNQSANSTVLFNITARDDTNLRNISIFTNTSGTWKRNETAVKNGTINSSNFTITNIKDGTYKWGGQACDAGGNCNWSSNRTFTIDTTLPTVKLRTPTNLSTITTPSKQVNFTYNVTDTNVVKNCSLWLSNANTPKTLLKNATDITITKTINQTFNVTNFKGGQYNWKVQCTDNFNNKGNSSRFNFTLIIDSDGPSINLISPPHGSQDADGIVRFTYTPTDISTINNCSLYAQDSLYSTTTSVTKDISNVIEVIGIQPNHALYSDGLRWFISCRDSLNNQGNSSVFNLDTKQETSSSGGGGISAPPQNPKSLTISYPEIWYQNSTVKTELIVINQQNNPYKPKNITYNVLIPGINLKEINSTQEKTIVIFTVDKPELKKYIIGIIVKDERTLKTNMTFEVKEAKDLEISNKLNLKISEISQKVKNYGSIIIGISIFLFILLILTAYFMDYVRKNKKNQKL